MGLWSIIPAGTADIGPVLRYGQNAGCEGSKVDVVTGQTRTPYTSDPNEKYVMSAAMASLGFCIREHVRHRHTMYCDLPMHSH